ncbi:MAG: NAD(P)/FAD-dependent oxidoreductase [Desulfopila sp.]
MKKIAIIGSGISGLTCAYHLCQDNDITLFEANDYIGGHTRTVNLPTQDREIGIDTGFIVFNDRTYPHFISLMEEIGVASQPTEMSFSVRNDAINLEYNGHSLTSLFAQRSNLLRPRFVKMLAEIVRFNKDVGAHEHCDDTFTLGAFLKKGNYSEMFQYNYLIPMVSAIWSMGSESCRDFPLRFFIRFFSNHGLLDITNRPQWYTIIEGSSSYIPPLTAAFRHRIRLNSPVTQVTRRDHGVEVTTPDTMDTFDEVICACHGDQALAILANPTTQEKRLLEKFVFTTNHVVLHTDISHLPRRKRAWASWNYRMLEAAKERTTLTYNMNILQCLDCSVTYLVSLNQDIEDRHILGEYNYAHPVYTVDSIAAQQQWHTISGCDNIHYCGAYWHNGFHEDGVRSALRVCDTIRRLEQEGGVR